MDIVSLNIENFLTIGSAPLNLDSKGLVLVQGKNEDDPSADSNGAGKSSIPDALCWALYGVTARGVTGDAVINKTIGKNCRVEVTIRDGDDAYKIARHRKHALGKNNLTVHKFPAIGLDGKTTVMFSDLTKGTDKLTQPVVDKIMGCSVDVFRAAVYAGQEAMPDLPAMTDKQLKLLVEEAAGVDKLQAAEKLAREDYNGVKRDLDRLETAIEAQERRGAELAGEILGLEEKVGEWVDQRKERIQEQKRLAAEELKGVGELKGKIESAGETALQEERDAINERLDKVADEKRKLDELSRAVSLNERDVARSETRLTTAKRDAGTLKKNLEKIAEREGQPCGECGKVYTAADLDEATSIARDRLRQALIEVQREKTELETAQATLEKSKQMRDDHAAGMTDVSADTARLRQIADELDKIAGLRRELEGKTAAARRHAERVKEIEKESNPFETLLEAKHTALAGAKEQLATLKKQRAELEERHDVLVSACAVFGAAGVRAHILDTVTPYLNDRTAHYLGILSDGNISATWSTLSTTAKGDLREKFNIDVTNDKGAESFGGLSGGEKRKVRLATALALQDLVASRATKPINLWVGDEVDHALDEAGLERLMTILDEKAKERGTVLVISHNELSAWIPDVCMVTKDGGISTVSGVIAK